MKRRDFLGLLGLAAAAPVVALIGDKREVSPVGDGVALNNVSHPRWVTDADYEAIVRARYEAIVRSMTEAHHRALAKWFLNNPNGEI